MSMCNHKLICKDIPVFEHMENYAVMPMHLG